MRVLIIEDDAATARSLKSILVSDGASVEIVDLGGDGLARGKAQECNAIILDLLLPDMHGLKVLEALRATGIDTPILIVSGEASADVRANSLELGADDYLTKPFNARELLARLHAIVRRSAGNAGLITEANDAKHVLGTLTARELDVLRMLVAGFPNKVAAHELGISPRTVEIHRARIIAQVAHAQSVECRAHCFGRRAR